MPEIVDAHIHLSERQDDVLIPFVLDLIMRPEVKDLDKEKILWRNATRVFRQ